MPSSATARIAEKLAQRQAGASTKAKGHSPEEEDADEAAASAGDETPEPEDTKADDELETIEEAETPKPRGTLAQRQAERKAAKAAPAPEPKAASKAKPATPAAKGKKPASPAQLAAREAFAAKARERAAAAAAAREEAAEPKKPVQTETDVKARQTAQRKAAQTARANGTKPHSTPTSKAVTVKAPKAAPAAEKAKATKAAAKTKPAKEPKAPARVSPKTEILALWDKGKTRREIMEATGLSYASVFFHTRGVEGAGNGARGRIFVDTNLDAEGKKIPRGKTENVSRSEAMRRDYMAGMNVADIKDKYDVRYQIAYTACRSVMNRANED